MDGAGVTIVGDLAMLGSVCDAQTRSVRARLNSS
jgi:hypothetical protein